LPLKVADRNDFAAELYYLKVENQLGAYFDVEHIKTIS